MPEKDPSNYSVLTYLWVSSLAAWGGVVGYIRKVNREDIPRYSITEFVGEVVTSAFAGMLTFWLCQAAGINGLVTAAMVGISGHMGSRAIYQIENWLQRKAV
jgi:predicted CDP-diglyceride synthetase/phosphatidate cytidylyltransferase